MTMSESVDDLLLVVVFNFTFHSKNVKLIKLELFGRGSFNSREGKMETIVRKLLRAQVIFTLVTLGVFFAINSFLVFAGETFHGYPAAFGACFAALFCCLTEPRSHKSLAAGVAFMTAALVSLFTQVPSGGGPEIRFLVISFAVIWGFGSYLTFFGTYVYVVPRFAKENGLTERKVMLYLLGQILAIALPILFTIDIVPFS